MYPCIVDQHMLAHPCEKCFAVARNRIPGDVEGVVAPIVAKRVGWVRAAWYFGDGAHCPIGQNGGVRTGCAQIIDDFFYGHERLRRCQHRFFLHADDALEEYIAGAVGPLSMDDGEVWPDGGYGGELLSREGAFDKADARVDSHQV